MVGLLARLSALIALVICGLLIFGSHDSGAATAAAISLDTSTRYQTISGWEFTAQAGEGMSGFSKIQNGLFDRAVNELGLNRVRVEIKPGSNGFNLGALDSKFNTIVIPVKRLVESNGEHLVVNVTYVGSAYHLDSSGYAQQVLATYRHLKSRFGFTPDRWEIALEPDTFGWGNASNVANAITATGALLEKNGFNAAFVAPSNSSMAGALSYFDVIGSTRGAVQYVSELSYHRYSGISDTTLGSIAARAVSYGIDTAMLEHIGSGYQDLHKDLTVGRVSAWQQYTLAYPATDNGAQYFWIGGTATQPQVNVGSRTGFLQQYFKYVRGGAVRIGANTTDGAFDPVAFVNPDRSTVVVVKAASGGSFTVQGLPAGTYGTTYTTSGVTGVAGQDVTVSSGQTLDASIPAAGVITIFRKQSGGGSSSNPPPSPSISTAQHTLSVTNGTTSATITSIVTARLGDGSPARGAVVSVELIDPVGRKRTLRHKTNGDGQAVSALRVRLPGAYSARVTRITLRRYVFQPGPNDVAGVVNVSLPSS